MGLLDHLIRTALLAGVVLLSSCGGGLDAAGQQGSQEKVVSQPPPSGSTVPVEVSFAAVAEDAFSGVHEARTVVVRDATAWATLWAAHGNGRSPAPAMPQVDFSTSMVVAVFAGQTSNGCRQAHIDKVSAEAGKIVVRYQERDLQTFAICTQAVGSPMVAVTVARSDAVVEFVNVNPVHLAFRELDRSSHSLVAEPKNVVVRDAAAFALLWSEHGGAQPVPNVDFNRQMVIGVFMGSRPNGCYSTAIDSIVRANGKLAVARSDSEPGPADMCTMAFVNPAHIVTVERSDDPVEFTSQLKAIR